MMSTAVARVAPRPTVAGNHARVIVVGNTVTGSWMIANNIGTPITVAGNHH
jgi:hypothetical protein